MNTNTYIWPTERSNKSQSFFFWCSTCGNEMAGDKDSMAFEEQDTPPPAPRTCWIRCGTCATMHIGSLDIAPFWVDYATDTPLRIGYP